MKIAKVKMNTTEKTELAVNFSKRLMKLETLSLETAISSVEMGLVAQDMHS